MQPCELKKHFSILILTAFALAVGIFWYDAIKEMLKPITDGATGWVGLTIIAIIITFIALGVAWGMNSMFRREREECERKHGKWNIANVNCDYKEE